MFFAPVCLLPVPKHQYMRRVDKKTHRKKTPAYTKRSAVVDDDDDDDEQNKSKRWCVTNKTIVQLQILFVDSVVFCFCDG